MASGLRAVHVVPGLDEAHGGPSYSVPRLCGALAALGANISLLSVAARPDAVSISRKDGYNDLRFPQDASRVPLLRHLRKSSRLSSCLHKEAAEASVVHNHGLWLLPNLAAGRAAKLARTPLVISPRGMLSPAALEFSFRKKRLLWSLAQARMVWRAECLHATSELEYQELRSFGLKNPVAVIPNGIDIPAAQDAVDGRPRTVLFLGRMHPKKGLDRLLRAWARIEQDFPQWRLRLVGPPEINYGATLERLIAELHIRRCTLEPAAYGDAKHAAYRHADIFVFPSLSENFGLTVAEALASGVPVIATKGTPWGGLAQKECGWWIEQGVEPLAAALSQAMAVPSAELKQMGQRGRAWMAAEFSWDHAAAEMARLYTWLDGKGSPPQSVRFR